LVNFSPNGSDSRQGELTVRWGYLAAGSSVRQPGLNADQPCPNPQGFPGLRTSGLYIIRFVGAGGNASGGLFQVTPMPYLGGVQNVDQWEHVTMAPLGDPRLKVTKTPDNATFNVGDPLTFSIKVENLGFATATNVMLSDQLPTTGGLTWAIDAGTTFAGYSIDAFRT
jgi:uncharacterized repeat protein (TIGR01451 family)